jgi:hypothetical protein
VGLRTVPGGAANSAGWGCEHCLVGLRTVPGGAANSGWWGYEQWLVKKTLFIKLHSVKLKTLLLLLFFKQSRKKSVLREVNLKLLINIFKSPILINFYLKKKKIHEQKRL